MWKTSPEQQLLDVSRTRRQIFQLRFCEYSPLERYTTAKWMIDLSARLAKEIGRMPDSFIYGRDVLGAAEAQKFLATVTRFQQEAEEQGAHEGVTACLALKAMAGLVVLRHMPAQPSVAMQAAQAFAFMLTIVDSLMAEYRTLRHTDIRLS